MAAAARMVKVEDSVAVVAAAVFVDPPVAGPSIIGKGVGQLGSTVGAEAFAHVATAGLPHMSSLPVQVSHFSRAGQVYPSIVDNAAGRRSLDMTLALPPIQFAETRVAVSNVDSFEQQHHRHGEGRQGMVRIAPTAYSTVGILIGGFIIEFHTMHSRFPHLQEFDQIKHGGLCTNFHHVGAKFGHVWGNGCGLLEEKMRVHVGHCRYWVGRGPEAMGGSESQGVAQK